MQEAANFAVKRRYLKLRDRELRLSHAKADATPSKRLNTPSKRLETPSKRPNSSPAQAPSTPAKKPVASRSPSISITKPDKKPSYQGLRATKPTAHKKTPGGEKPKVRKTKRPSVAARRAKPNFAKEDGPPKQAGTKRKLDSRTPDSSLRAKKKNK